jgi:protein phosphatase
MISTSSIINCTNPTGVHQTPLIYRYLWATGEGVPQIAAGEIVAGRYEVVAPQIWRDTKLKELPDSEKLPIEVTAYSKLYNQHLHIPQVYSLIASDINTTKNNILLLENVPIDDNGNIYPVMSDVWEQTTSVRQVYWLWQILELWQPLSKLGMAASLLLPSNLRVEGWCVRLLELVGGTSVSIQQLGESWQPLVLTAHPTVSDQLQSIIRQITQQALLEDIRLQLNHLLLSAASELPLNFQIFGATIEGAQLKQNEDACFPTNTDIEDPQLARVSIVCDGIGGHEGGEVASQLAVQSVKLQIRALLTEATLSQEPVPPDLFIQQLEASLRVVNNLICSANDQEHREGKQRMGTTLVMAVQVAQTIQTTMGWDAENSHELYIANIGDSRAYWITRDRCQQLTVDDDIATREARSGRSLYRKALNRPDAGALTQALGTKEAQNLHFAIQRLIIEEDGLLVLCSDGFSDNNLVEQTWQAFALPILNGEISVSEGVDAWINTANISNGHDNISLVLNYCRVSPDYVSATSQAPLHIFDTSIEAETEPEVIEVGITSGEPELDLSAQPALLLELPQEAPVEKVEAQTPTKKVRRSKPLVWLIGLILLLLGSASLGLFMWRRYSPRTFGSLCRQLPATLTRICPNRR